MTCPNCGTVVPAGTKKRHRGESIFCPNCGTLLGMSSPQEEERNPLPDPSTAQQQLLKPAEVPSSPGPLLTGHLAMDTVLGFLGEVVGVALIVYAIVIFALLAFNNSGNPRDTALMIAGSVATSLFLFWHAATMRKRYPNYARGWQRGRDTWGKGVEHILTLFFGVMTLAILFPLGGLLICLGMAYGPIAWVIALVIAYGFGHLVRRMFHPSKGNKRP